jgi:hypothetical protein
MMLIPLLVTHDKKDDALVSLFFGKGRNLISSSYEYSLSLLVYIYLSNALKLMISCVC